MATVRRLVAHLADDATPHPPKEFWGVCNAVLTHGNQATLDGVLAVYGMQDCPMDCDAAAATPEPWFSTAPGELGFTAADDDDTPKPCAELKVNAIYMVNTTNDDDTGDSEERSFFVLLKIDPDGIGHRIRWFYTPEQVIADGAVLDEAWDHDIARLTAKGAHALFLSDHEQPLGDVATWLEVDNCVAWNPNPVAPIHDMYYVVGTYSSTDDSVDNGLRTWFLTRLLDMGRDGGTRLRKLISDYDQCHYGTNPQTNRSGRCQACGYARDLKCLFTFGDSKGRRPPKELVLGTTCAQKIQAAIRLNNCHDDDLEACIAAAKTALVA